MRKNSIRSYILYFALFIFFIGNLRAMTIKIGTVAPLRSPWIKELRKLGIEWGKITKGLVRIKIYAGGIAGSEKDMVRKIRMGILGGAVFTNIGITEINSDSYIFNFPFFLDSDDELDFIMTKVTPLFEKNIEKKGFKVIVWSNAGWVYFFSKKPIFYPKDLKKCKLSFSTGITAMANAWRKSGYRIVPNELKDTMMALQSGMVDSFYLPPIIAASGQYFSLAKNMYQLKIGPVVGGVIISNKIWKHIPDEFKNKMINVAKKMAYNLSIKTKELEKDAIREMKKHGLRINNAPADALEKWRAAANKGLDKLVGKAFSEEIYNLCNQYIKEYRKKTPNEKQNKRNN